MIPCTVSRRSAIAAASAALLALSAPQALAWRIVYDPTNHIQNTIAAVKAVAAEITRYQQLITEIRQNMNLFKIVEGAFGNTPELQMLRDGYKAVSDAYQSAKKLKGALTEGKKTVETLVNAFASSNVKTWREFAHLVMERRKLGEASAVRLMDSVHTADRQIQAAADSHKQIVKQLRNVSGVTEATQATANAIGVLIEQNQAMLLTLSAQANDMAIERQRKTMQRESNERANMRFEKLLEDAYKRSKERIEKMKSQI